MNLPDESQTAQPKWRPLNRLQRRVLGVLIEKSKTTPDVYPMTLNSITTAANQKSNRSPLMSLTPDEVQSTLEQLKQIGAVIEVHGDGRVAKFKHLLYDWFGVDKAELAVLAELMLRGHQTLGQLRARAARMEDIADLTQLKPIVDSLLNKKLMQELSPAGRGQVVSHDLYQAEEMDKLRAAVAQMDVSGDDESDEPSTSTGSKGGGSSIQQRLEAIEKSIQNILERLERLES